MNIWKILQKKNNSSSGKPEFRHEFKYLISNYEMILLENRLKTILQMDLHLNGNAYYQIRSVYFDDYANTCFWKNESGTDPRAKYRIRIYDCSDQMIRLEKKIKQNGLTRKKSALLTKDQADLLIQGKGLPLDSESFQTYPLLLKQFLLLQKTRKMEPKVIVSYDRTPYVGKQGNVRITMDRNISASTDFSHFFDENMFKIPILPKEKQLIEVKYDEFLPGYVRQQMEIGRLRQETFSKYYLCRKRIMR